MTVNTLLQYWAHFITSLGPACYGGGRKQETDIDVTSHGTAWWSPQVQISIPCWDNAFNSNSVFFFGENYLSVKTSSRCNFVLKFIKELHGGVWRSKHLHWHHISQHFIKRHFYLSIHQGLHGSVCWFKYQNQVVIMHSTLSASIYCIWLYSGKQNLCILCNTNFRYNFWGVKKCVKKVKLSP
jgi:hypothetical protein